MSGSGRENIGTQLITDNLTDSRLQNVFEILEIFLHMQLMEPAKGWTLVAETFLLRSARWWLVSSMPVYSPETIR